jgi:hypothetical protein
MGHRVSRTVRDERVGPPPHFSERSLQASECESVMTALAHPRSTFLHYGGSIPPECIKVGRFGFR